LHYYGPEFTPTLMALKPGMVHRPENHRDKQVVDLLMNTTRHVNEGSVALCFAKTSLADASGYDEINSLPELVRQDHYLKP
jgi:hypothetical protein